MTDDITKKFGKAIRQLRCERQISQEEFADMCGMHRSYMSDVELGKRNISLENIEKIAMALCIPIAQLFSIVEDMR